MRVTFIGISGYAYPHTRVRCFHFARELAKHDGFETRVLSFRDHLAPRLSEVEMFDRCRDRLKGWLTLKALGHLLPQRRTIFYVQKAHFHSAAPFVLHRLRLNPYVFDYDDYDVELSNFFARGIYNRICFGDNRWDGITWKLAREARACVASSRVLYDLLKAHNPHTYHIATGVDAEHFTLRDFDRPSEDVVFLWTGLVWGDEVYGFVMLILDAFAEVLKVCPNARLRFVGGGQRIDDLKADIARRDYRDRVEVKDWVEPREMPAMLREADVGLLPLTGDTLWARSKSPTKLFEYMSAGLTVVASAVGEPIHVIRDGVNGFLAADAETFARRMIDAGRDADLRRRLGTAARETVLADYSLPVLGEKLAAMFRERFG